MPENNPALHKITIYRGDTFDMTVTWQDEAGTPIDISSYTSRMHIRDTVDGSALLTLSDGSGTTIDGPSGEVTIVITAAQTAALVFANNDEGVYDVEITSPAGAVDTLVYGAAKLIRDTTYT